MASDTSGLNKLVAGIKGALRIAQTARVLAQTGVEWLQVEGLIGDPEVWALAAQGAIDIPLDVVLDDPATEFSSLYRLVDVRLARSVRLTIPAKPGLMKALRMAASLSLPVRIPLACARG